MIMAGFTYEQLDCHGHYLKKKDIFEANDYHEAAVQMIKMSRTTGYWSFTVIDGEFHDTETLKTWSVDSRGHTKKDYRNELTKDFALRWNEVLHDSQRIP